MMRELKNRKKINKIVIEKEPYNKSPIKKKSNKKRFKLDLNLQDFFSINLVLF